MELNHLEDISYKSDYEIIKKPTVVKKAEVKKLTEKKTIDANANPVKSRTLIN